MATRVVPRARRHRNFGEIKHIEWRASHLSPSPEGRLGYPLPG